MKNVYLLIDYNIIPTNSIEKIDIVTSVFETQGWYFVKKWVLFIFSNLFTLPDVGIVIKIPTFVP